MWLTAEYLATTLFTLKPAWATSSGGKTLLVPTPYAVKMALLDVVCRTEGTERGEQVWPWLRDRRMALRPAPQVVVNNTFTKIWKPNRRYNAGSEFNPADKSTWPMQDTIGYREYAYLDGRLGLAFEVESDADAEVLSVWLLGINYLGKRGGFVQLAAAPQVVERLPDGYIPVTGTLPGEMPMPTILQQLDECGESLSFEQASVYSGKPVRLGKERVLYPVALPYRVVASSQAYTWYARHEERV
ncbi:MAG TPA: hypothetical protein PK801_15330 [Aggregatilineales bacterium]|nr:hypothetical protein [Chloroflexota bacterium]HOA25515.1 hypothetical protein [Aggregatilineales bacterium]HPV08983.1 hypothetical protein [Aggregatilineales bacterium]HQA69696.1 hypothetical protein [Aggregatilineales bacterium]HQE18903.1 hypothetical protein [Aggregatilineales bacterium]